MDMFRSKNDVERSVEKATSEMLLGPDWSLIMGVCDDVSGKGGDAARDALRAVRSRLKTRNTKVQLLALTLTEALMKNGGAPVHVQASSEEFIREVGQEKPTCVLLVCLCVD